jgi:hypothetical protein
MGLWARLDARSTLQDVVRVVNAIVGGMSGLESDGKQWRNTEYDGENPSVNGSTGTTGNYSELLRSPIGNHRAVLFSGIDPSVTPTPANAILIENDEGLTVGSGKATKWYDPTGATFAKIESATGADATLTGHLWFPDNTHDIGAAGTSRPRNLYLAGSAEAAAGMALGPGISVGAGQLAFPATQNPSGGANTLDDYEEGTWTPSLGGSATYSAQTGRYTKIGNVVTVTCRLGVTTLGTGSVNLVSGLPFVSAMRSCGAVSAATTMAVSPVFVSADIANGSTTAQMNGLTAAGANMAAVGIFGNGTAVTFSATYFTS